MPELLKDILIGLGSSLFLERAPFIARSIVKQTASELPESLKARYEADWLATLEYVDGPLSKLGVALQIMMGLPSLRISHRLSPFSRGRVLYTLAFLNFIIGAGLMGLSLFSQDVGKLTESSWTLWIFGYGFSFLTAIGLCLWSIAFCAKYGKWWRLVESTGLLIAFIWIFSPLIRAQQGGLWDLTALPIVIAMVIMTVLSESASPLRD